MNVTFDDVKELLQDFGKYLNEVADGPLSDEALEEALDEFLDQENERLLMFSEDIKDEEDE